MMEINSTMICVLLMFSALFMCTVIGYLHSTNLTKKAHSYKYGIGVKVDKEKAIRLYKEAFFINAFNTFLVFLQVTHLLKFLYRIL